MKNKIRYSCVVDTTYTLSLYLLLQTEDSINDTAFFVGRAIPQDISSMLPYVVRIDNRQGTYDTRIQKIKHRIVALIRWRFRNKTIFYAQDHLAYSAHIIGNNNYILLEDAPYIYTNYKSISFMKPIMPTSIKSKVSSWLYWGGIERKRLGTNNQCVNRIVTKMEDLNSDILKGKPYTLVDLHNLWKSSSVEKQNYIRKIFDITEEMLMLPNNNSVILFSQPLMEDCQLTEDEIMDIFNPYIHNYLDKGIVIKPHPRDKFDYKKHYPSVEILHSKAPMQLLCAMGVVFKTAITVCSSAVSSLSKDTQIVWIGSNINPKVFKIYGDLKCPR